MITRKSSARVRSPSSSFTRTGMSAVHHSRRRSGACATAISLRVENTKPYGPRAVSRCSGRTKGAGSRSTPCLPSPTGEPAGAPRTASAHWHCALRTRHGRDGCPAARAGRGGLQMVRGAPRPPRRRTHIARGRVLRSGVHASRVDGKPAQGGTSLAPEHAPVDVPVRPQAAAAACAYVTMLPHQADGPLPDLRGKRLPAGSRAHAPNLAQVGASSNPGRFKGERLQSRHQARWRCCRQILPGTLFTRQSASR